MKKILFGVALVGVAGIGYLLYLDQHPAENQEPIRLDVGASGDNFARNQECLKSKGEISQKLETKESPFGEASLEQIFYSPKTESCVYVEYTVSETTHYNRRLFDIGNDGWNSKPLLSCNALRGSAELMEAYKSIDSDLEQYQKEQAGCDDFDNQLAAYK